MSKVNKNKKILGIFILLICIVIGILMIVFSETDLPEGVYISEEICAETDENSESRCIPSKYVLILDDYTEDLSKELCEQVGGYYERVFVGWYANYNYDYSCLLNEPI